MSFEEYRPQRFNILPLVVKNLLILNGLFYLATLAFQNALNIDLSDMLGLHYPLSPKFKPYQLVTYLFMHGSFMHLFFNMFALWMFGNVLENYWGPKRFLTYYVVTGIGAAVIHYSIFYFQNQSTISFVAQYLANPDLKAFQDFIRLDNFQALSQDMIDHYNNTIPTLYREALINSDISKATAISVDFMQQYRIDYLNAPVIVGASGSVFGILLAFGMLFPNTLLYIYFAIPIKAKWFVILYGAAELYSGISNQTGDNVAHFAHLGGMLFGFILIKLWQRNRNSFY
jgi:membrane associated rhomboid family serine protease